MAANGFSMAHLPYMMGIAIGLSSIVFSSAGINNAKTKKGGAYRIQVMGLILAILWTLYFLWKIAKASGYGEARSNFGAAAIGGVQK
jgi:hypothetical protein